MATVRDLVRAAQREIRDTEDLPPDRAAELLNRLTALIGNCNDEVLLREVEYKRVLLECLKTHEKANRARIEAETTPQYQSYQEARHTQQLTVELCRTLKAFLRIKGEEMRLAH